MASDQKRQAALAALMESNTLTEAAERAHISRRSLYQYMNRDPAFARAYDEMRNQQAIVHCEALQARRDAAYNCIMEIMQDTDKPSGVRLKAAQTIIQAAAAQEKILND